MLDLKTRKRVEPHEPHEYREDCPGCQLTILSPDGPLLPDDPVVLAGAKAWAALSLESKKACHRVWAFNSMEDEDLRIAGDLMERIRGLVEGS